MLPSSLLAACCLHLAVRLAPEGGAVWSEELASRCGFPTAVIAHHVSLHMTFLDHTAVSCRRLSSGTRARTLVTGVVLLS